MSIQAGFVQLQFTIRWRIWLKSTSLFCGIWERGMHSTSERADDRLKRGFDQGAKKLFQRSDLGYSMQECIFLIISKTSASRPNW